MPRIDFNCDLGEGCGDDAAIMPWISSANIACGGHAGDDALIRTTLRLCMSHGVAAGAHPGYPDPEHFGRRELEMSPQKIGEEIRAQLQRIAIIADAESVPLVHVKPHGALYNRAARDAEVAHAIATAVRDVDPTLILVGLSGSQSTRAGAAIGLRVAHEVFAERGYAADGTLLPRGVAGAVLDDSGEAVTQALRLVRDGMVIADNGAQLALRADTLCLHGDRDHAAAFARALRIALEQAGILILGLGVTE
ncbi:MAG: LamB/YcsF family protein [Lysobacteraceae bacterium]|nr:MAG: LamB/YcsF family protein [Xanthomonadaceae bacterium]